MKKNNASLKINGMLGQCGGLETFLGFAPADKLCHVSFADVLNEDTGEGYQRKYNKSHSIDFKRYISQPNASTIPLTFNLRKEMSDEWKITTSGNGKALLEIKGKAPCLAQVDCQHRLSELHDVKIPLAFMAFIGLDYKQEMALFYIINSKAKGLSSSLTDYHESNLMTDLANDAPHLYIAKRLNEDPDSPWFRFINYGGHTISSPKRRTSLRMMQKALYRFFIKVQNLELGNIDNKYNLVIAYWKAIKALFRKEWDDHRHHLLTKGIGVYSLTFLLADILLLKENTTLEEDYFIAKLTPLKNKVDWCSQGMFSHAGGHKGAIEVYKELQKLLLL